MSNQYVIQKETLDSIAAQSMNLVGKTDAVSTSEIITDLTSINTEVGTQANLIEQIQTALENKEGGDTPSVTGPVLQSKTVTPTASQIEVVADDGYDGLEKVTVEGDTELIAVNIKKGVNIFGIDGNFTEISDGTAAGASDIANGKKAYVNGEKITGSVQTVEADVTEVVSANWIGINKDVNFVGNVTMTSDLLLRENSRVQTLAPLSWFGDAKPEDVADGKFFTSSEGVMVKGTATAQETLKYLTINSYVEYDGDMYSMDLGLSDLSTRNLISLVAHSETIMEEDNEYWFLYYYGEKIYISYDGHATPIQKAKSFSMSNGVLSWDASSGCSDMDVTVEIVYEV